jgi:mRNA-degrading endonuclease toxin of MazEF toxin-antitoxin module
MVDIPISQTVGSEQQKRRPYVVMSRLSVNKLGKNVVGIPLSHVINKANQHRILIPAKEIIKDATSNFPFVNSVALTDQVRVLDISRLELPRIGYLSTTATIAVQLGLAFLFDIR